MKAKVVITFVCIGLAALVLAIVLVKQESGRARTGSERPAETGPVTVQSDAAEETDEGTVEAVVEEPVEGLSLSAAPEKKEFGAKEKLVFHLTFSNIGETEKWAIANSLLDTSYTGPDHFARDAGIRLTEQDTEKAWDVCCMAEINRTRARSDAPAAELAPGESWRYRLTIGRILSFACEDASRPVKSLPPGVYVAEITLRFAYPDEFTAIPWYSGELTSRTDEFRILE